MKIPEISPAFLSTVLFFFGLSIGSFLNVLIYRVPRKESLASPPSHCPYCGKKILFYDNIPLISFILLKGKCRFCGEKISLRYPLVELFTALLFLFSFYLFGFSLKLVSALFFLSVLLALSLIDLETFLIPNRIIIPSIAVSVLLLAFSFLGFPFLPLLSSSPLSSFLGAILSGGIIYLIVTLSPFFFGKEGMGFGDIKLAVFIGLYLGYYVVVALFFAFLLGGVVGVVLIYFQKKGRRDEIPFGPFLALGAFFSLFLAQPLAHWYLGLLR